MRHEELFSTDQELKLAQFALTHLSWVVTALFFKGRFKESAFFFLNLSMSLSKVQWNFTTFPAFLDTLDFHVPISRLWGL